MFSIHIFVVALILEAIISTPFIPAPDKTASVGSHDLLKSINYHMKRSLEEGGSSSITCSICHAPMSDDEVRCWPNCQHPFHSRCIGPWFVIPGSTCPLCRGSGSKIEGTTGQENSLQNPNTLNWKPPQFSKCPKCSASCKPAHHIPDPIYFFCQPCDEFWVKKNN
ncbi:hypothetical protein PGT21_026641 [Puccinia graminis f. sp. tritici]|uniref:RING-type domain-containing protein n=1 Tax=Puccinia graminis f. sp. tritici TaxID=56615 RepID=A0A5B0Q6S9_PUCGR|nr:hypothetical protein PGT21_025354 [Puccinia graminis f. sp. tritici]KAA1108827.1 hypothetical protein PGT21_026641 [Puccinia graminis f. sp. tritici]KAA1122341.1 hypothetical protein PGTUg99_036824 [Puccinia graminis f. sp. tritici]KAA1129011.1 hypothetical protein PGTUg99_023025 [Puccinia graminis f. sp. tritici]